MSIFGPLLFLIFINDLIFEFDENEHCILFADDTTIHTSGSNLESCVDSLSQESRQDIVTNVSSSNTISVRRTCWAKPQSPWSKNSNYWAYCWKARWRSWQMSKKRVRRLGLLYSAWSQNFFCQTRRVCNSSRHLFFHILTTAFRCLFIIWLSYAWHWWNYTISFFVNWAFYDLTNLIMFWTSIRVIVIVWEVLNAYMWSFHSGQFFHIWSKIHKFSVYWHKTRDKLKSFQVFWICVS